MSNGTPVPATAFSTFAMQVANPPLSELVIGDKSYSPSGQQSDASFIWLVVVDLTDLSVVANDVSTDGSTVPADIAKYAGNDQYFLYAVSNAAWSTEMPTGALYTLLQQAGAGDGLARLEQIYAQIGTGYLGTFSYILAASMGSSDAPGFEEMSMTDFTLLTMSFLPVTVGGNTIYAPIRVGTG